MGCGSSGDSEGKEPGKGEKNPLETFWYPAAFTNRLEELKLNKNPFVLELDFKNNNDVTDA